LCIFKKKVNHPHKEGNGDRRDAQVGRLYKDRILRKIENEIAASLATSGEAPRNDEEAMGGKG